VVTGSLQGLHGHYVAIETANLYLRVGAFGGRDDTRHLFVAEGGIAAME